MLIKMTNSGGLEGLFEKQHSTEAAIVIRFQLKDNAGHFKGFPGTIPNCCVTAT